MCELLYPFVISNEAKALLLLDGASVLNFRAPHQRLLKFIIDSYQRTPFFNNWAPQKNHSVGAFLGNKYAYYLKELAV